MSCVYAARLTLATFTGDFVKALEIQATLTGAAGATVFRVANRTKVTPYGGGGWFPGFYS